MNKQVLAASVALGIAIASGVNAAPIDFAPTGSGPALTLGAYDFPPTSFLAAGANTAILNFITGAGPTNFQVYLGAAMSSIFDPDGVNITPPGLGRTGPGGFELTMIMGFTSAVTGVDFATNSVSFATAPNTSSFLRIYYDALPNSDYLTGSGFNDGLLIASSNTIGASTGSFQTLGGFVDDLDQSGNPQYTGQQSVLGFGINDDITFSHFNPAFGGGVDPAFFRNYPTTDGGGLTLTFSNVNQQLPFFDVNPTDCFTRTPLATPVGTTNVSFACDSAHVNGLYSAQGAAASANGIVPDTGPMNGGLFQGPDFVSQTDFAGVADTPEPGSIALVVLGLGAFGLVGRRRRPQAALV